MATRYQDAANAADTPVAFVDAVEPMLASLADLHVWVEMPDGNMRSPFRSGFIGNYNHQFVESQLDIVQRVDGIGVVGLTEEGFGYVAVNALPAEWDYDRLISLIQDLFEAPGIVFDLRRNSGGSESQAARIAGLFASQRTRYARNQVRLEGDPSAMRETPPREFGPTTERPFLKPVVCMIGPGCVSSGEGLALMMKALEHVTLVGQPTRGASGNPRPVTLSNGVRVWFSRWVSLELDGTPIEGAGVRPDVRFEHRKDEGDATFSRALDLLREKTEND